MIPKKPARDLIRAGYGFRKRSCFNNKPERDDDTGKLIPLQSAPSFHVFARIVGPFVAALAHQLLELAVFLFRQHDPHAGEEVAAPALSRQSLALEAEGTAG